MKENNGNASKKDGSLLILIKRRRLPYTYSLIPVNHPILCLAWSLQAPTLSGGHQSEYGFLIEVP